MKTTLNIPINPRCKTFCGSCKYANTIEKCCRLFSDTKMVLNNKELSLVRSEKCLTFDVNKI